MKFALPVKVTTAVARTSLKAQKNAPQLLFAGGIVLGVATVVTACKATLGVEKTLDEHRQHVEWAKANDVDERKEVALAYAVTTKKLVRAYGPAVVLGVGSVACLTQSHRILTSRNAALTASYAALDKAFDQYRGRVRNRLGDEVEREIFYNVEEETEEVEKKDGSTKKVKTKKSKGGGSGYARLFEENNKNWDSNPDYRVAFLRLKQNQLNDMLNSRGHLFLNEAYDELGLPRCEAGQAVGWLRGDHPEAKDGYIDFGIFTDKSMEQFYNFAAGFEPIWLDFNVDGTIMDKI